VTFIERSKKSESGLQSSFAGWIVIDTPKLKLHFGLSMAVGWEIIFGLD